MSDHPSLALSRTLLGHFSKKYSILLLIVIFHPLILPTTTLPSGYKPPLFLVVFESDPNLIPLLQNPIAMVSWTKTFVLFFNKCQNIFFGELLEPGQRRFKWAKIVPLHSSEWNSFSKKKNKKKAKEKNIISWGGSYVHTWPRKLPKTLCTVPRGKVGCNDGKQSREVRNTNTFTVKMTSVEWWLGSESNQAIPTLLSTLWFEEKLGSLVINQLI